MRSPSKTVPWAKRYYRFELLEQPVPIPASSTAGQYQSRVISDRRARLNPALAGKLLFVSDNWDWWIDELNYDKIASEVEEVDEVDEVDE